MRLAYLIIAHQQPEQLAQMLYCIQHPDNVYLVMPDSKGLTGSEPALQAWCVGTPTSSLPRRATCAGRPGA